MTISFYVTACWVRDIVEYSWNHSKHIGQFPENSSRLSWIFFYFCHNIADKQDLSEIFFINRAKIKSGDPRIKVKTASGLNTDLDLSNSHKKNTKLFKLFL
jgi:hypothetical protein